MQLYDELKARGLIAQVTNEEGVSFIYVLIISILSFCNLTC